MLWEAFPHAGSGQVFVDDSGRRRRWIRVAGSVVTVACALYVGIVAAGLSQTAVGPLEAVPAGGNGEIAGFPNSAGTVPGLLQLAGSGARPVDRGARVPAATHRPLGAAARLTTARAATAHPATTHPATSPSTPGKLSTKGNGSAKNGGSGVSTRKGKSSDPDAKPRAA